MDMKNNTLPDSLHECLYGYIKTQVLYSCHSLGVFELLNSKAHGLSAVQVHDELCLSEQKSERLLDIATLLGLLKKQNHCYQLSDDCQPYLIRESEHYQGGFIAHIGDSSYAKFKQLNKMLSNDNNNDHEDDMGVDLNHEVFDQLYNDPSQREDFMEAMWNIGIQPAQELVQKLSLDHYSTLVDIGGGNGSFVIPLALQHKHIHATIFDIDPVKLNAEAKIKQYGLQTRVTFQCGDFWSDPFPKSDVFVFGFILSDWSTKDGKKLLRKAKNALNDNGMIIILEKLFETEKSKGPVETSLLDMAMMVEAKGMHRTETEYRQLLDEIGAESTFIERSSGSKHLIAGKF